MFEAPGLLPASAGDAPHTLDMRRRREIHMYALHRGQIVCKGRTGAAVLWEMAVLEAVGHAGTCVCFVLCTQLLGTLARGEEVTEADKQGTSYATVLYCVQRL